MVWTKKYLHLQSNNCFKLKLFLYIITFSFIAQIYGQSATFFTTSGKRLTGAVLFMRNDTLYVQVSKQDGTQEEKRLYKGLFEKVVFFTGENLNLSLSEYSPAGSTDGSWDELGDLSPTTSSSDTSIINSPVPSAIETPQSSLVENTKASDSSSVAENTNTDTIAHNDVVNEIARDTTITQSTKNEIRKKEDLETVAVQDFELRGLADPTIALSFSERFRGQLIATNQFRVMERNQMNLILQEQGFQLSGACADDECLVEIGQLIAVRKIIAGTIAKVGTIYTVTIKVIDVETGAIEKVLSEDCDCPIEKILTSTLDILARRTAGLKVDENKVAIELRKGDAILNVNSEPKGARIYIDGIMMEGITPANYNNLTSGEHLLYVVKGGYASRTKVKLRSGKVTEEHLKLKLQNTDLQVLSNPPGAEIYINNKPGERVHESEFRTPTVYKKIRKDSLEITLFKAGFKDTTVTITITPNTVNTVSFNLINLLEPDIQIQHKMISDRNRHATGRKCITGFSFPLVFGIGALIVAEQVFYKEALNLKHDLEASTFKSGSDFDEKMQRNETFNFTGNVFSTTGAILTGIGGVGISAGILLQF